MEHEAELHESGRPHPAAKETPRARATVPSNDKAANQPPVEIVLDSEPSPPRPYGFARSKGDSPS